MKDISGEKVTVRCCIAGGGPAGLAAALAAGRMGARVVLADDRPALGGSLFFLPFNLIQVQGYSATEAGAAFLPFTIIMGGLSRWSGGLIDRYGARGPLTVGPLIAAAGFALFAVPGIGGSYHSRTERPSLIAMGVTSSPPITAAGSKRAAAPSVGLASLAAARGTGSLSAHRRPMIPTTGGLSDVAM